MKLLKSRDKKQIKVVINRHKSDKFKQEILWRTYWKGWLEHHRDLWEILIMMQKSLNLLHALPFIE